MDEATARAMIEEHFDTASDDFARSSEICADDAVLEFPQGGERIRGKANIRAFRSAYPAGLSFDMQRTTGYQDLWVNEYIIWYDGQTPYHVVGIMEFRDGKVVRERIYFGGAVGAAGLAGPVGRADGDQDAGHLRACRRGGRRTPPCLAPFGITQCWSSWWGGCVWSLGPSRGPSAGRQQPG